MSRQTWETWNTPAPWALAWVGLMAVLLYSTGGRMLALAAFDHPIANDSIGLGLRYLNAFLAGLLSYRALRCRRYADGLWALLFATVLLIAGAAQGARDTPLTVGMLLFTVANFGVLWRWDAALDNVELS